jgi:hypothetical protein
MRLQDAPAREQRLIAPRGAGRSAKLTGAGGGSILALAARDAPATSSPACGPLAGAPLSAASVLRPNAHGGAASPQKLNILTRSADQ